MNLVFLKDNLELVELYLFLLFCNLKNEHLFKNFYLQQAKNHLQKLYLFYQIFQIFLKFLFFLQKVL